MSNVTPLRKMHVVAEQTERVFGSAKFIGLTRKVGLQSPSKFQPTTKNQGDIII